MNKLSIKLGLAFFFVFFGIIGLLLFFLHESIVNTYVEEEMTTLHTRGNSHRDVLEDNFNQNTIDHVMLMESSSDTSVVIINENLDIIRASTPVNDDMEAIINKVPLKIVSQNKEMFIETDFWTNPYVSTVSTFKYNDQSYFLFMFEPTDNLRILMKEMNQHFIYGTVISLIITAIVISFLTKIITKPLIKMKQATERISKGDFTVELPAFKDDELGRLSKAIYKLADDLKHLTESRKEFLASISHELRTPLTYIKGYADVCRKGLVSQQDKDKYIQVIYEESERVTKLIQDLFELAKIDQNQFSIQKTNVSLNDMLYGLYKRFNPAFDKEGKKLELQIKNEIWAYIDPIRMEQCLLNLLDNAKKYSLHNSTIKIEAFEKKNQIFINIQNESNPIDSRHLPRLFDRFYRVDPSRSRKLGGVGLGLSVVKEIIEAHDGTISFTSKEGIVTVILTLPGGLADETKSIDS
ncbi:HAMP domain-containing sensor histidine kinase [Bacillus litorisediminis]|uniref:HAMP domain-containing sensor histidine kinase n=1 Tax=Bacillus litorisediminis TaxID=2922713 RepID=UPI001FAEE420|nr:ATP-binding protein [Bacillus litorisediminis]